MENSVDLVREINSEMEKLSSSYNTLRNIIVEEKKRKPVVRDELDKEILALEQKLRDVKEFGRESERNDLKKIAALKERKKELSGRI